LTLVNQNAILFIRRHFLTNILKHVAIKEKRDYVS
jgi:hypothetical protein